MRRLRPDRGQAAVEFMLLFPFVLLVIVLIAEFGFAFYSYVTVNNAASEAARWAALGKPSLGCFLGPQPDSIEERVVKASSGLVKCSSSGSEIQVGYRSFDGAVKGLYVRGDQVVVKINHAYSPITPIGTLMSAFSFGSFPDTLPIKACSDARLEGPNTGLKSYSPSGCQ